MQLLACCCISFPRCNSSQFFIYSSSAFAAKLKLLHPKRNSKERTEKWPGKETRADPCTHTHTELANKNASTRASHVLTDRSTGDRDDGGWGDRDDGIGLAARRWDGVRKKIVQQHGEASGAAWFPFKEGE
jgi:hypothetical protein